jgi:dolichol-phosphate mannosyltransferase
MAHESPTKTLTLVVPTLNESGNIDPVLNLITNILGEMPYDYKVVVVDDGSADGTIEKVRTWTQNNNRVHLLQRAGERGLAGAVLYGWNQHPADLLAVMDADLQHPPDLLPKLLHEVEHTDIAIASRYAEVDGTKGWNPLRVAISRITTLAATRLISKKNLRVTDPMSGFFVVRRSCIEKLEFQTAGFKLLFEILVRGRIRSVQEVPYHFGLRHAGSSKASVSVAYDYLRLLSRLSREQVLRSSEP